MAYRQHAPPAPLLFGYDPFRDLPLDHLARLIEYVVEETVVPPHRGRQAGQPPYDPRLCIKVLVYSYCVGVRSSRVMERNCRESLPYLFLTRGEAPSYRTLCTARTEQGEFLEAVWEGLFSVAAGVGLDRLGRITLDSTKLRANASPDAVVTRQEFTAVRAELERIQAEVSRLDAQEEAEGNVGAAAAATGAETAERDATQRRRRRQGWERRRGDVAAERVGRTHRTRGNAADSGTDECQDAPAGRGGHQSDPASRSGRAQASVPH